MGAFLGKAASAPPWPELLPEIADLVLRRLPDHGDRLSFAAVCHEWRLAAGRQGLPPAMPYINHGDGSYASLGSGGEVRPFPTPTGYHAGACFGGGWLFYYHEGSGRCFLRRPFSGAAIEIRRSLHDFLTPTTGSDIPIVVLGRSMDVKMVMCSSGFVVALLRQVRVYTDIAFYDGKVFAVNSLGKLFGHAVDVEMNHHKQHPIMQHASGTRPATYFTSSYLVVSSDKQKLLMVRWRRRNNVDGHPATDLWVFEADFGTGRWLEVKDLGSQVLFIGQNCSMAFAAGSTDHWGPRFRGGNRVFVLGTEWARSFRHSVPYKGAIPNYCMYDMVSGETSLVLPHGPRDMESCTVGWFFPTSENL